VYQKFELPTTTHYTIKIADKRWTLTEKLQLQPNGPSWDGTDFADVTPFEYVIDPLGSSFAREAFLSQYFMLRDKIERLKHEAYSA